MREKMDAVPAPGLRRAAEVISPMKDWNALAGALRTLHAALLRRARAEYVREQGLSDIGPGELLMLATRDDRFAWLRSLSELMAEIDELRDSAETAHDPALRSAVRGAVEELLANPAEDAARTPFQEQYWRHVHGDPDVTMAHAAVRQTLRSWPEPHPAGRVAMTAKREGMAKKPRG